MENYYARRAAEYEHIYLKPERQEDLADLRHVVETAFTGRRVLELACGTGYWTERLSHVAMEVTALDVNDEVLEIALAKPVDKKKVAFEKADIYTLPKFGRTFDAGLAVFWWSHVPKARMGAFLAGFHGVLDPGASVVFIDNAYVEGSSTPIARVDSAGDTWQSRRLKDGSVHEVLKNFPDEAGLRDAVAGTGENVTVRFLRHYWILSYTTPR
jgi:demethylmenaquinone methyltransferase/2-methoxy-6-polyprenyl-1,4-benzoquinol methylase